MGPLTDTEVRALHEALDDEYHAWSIYDQVVADFGEVQPFSNIRDAEARHIEALRGLFAFYGLPVPRNRWPGRVERYASLRAACEAGAAAEVNNGTLYTQLLASTDREDVLAVFRRLREASLKRHRPAFLRCAQRRGGGTRVRHRRGGTAP